MVALSDEYPSQGSPMDAKDHPTNTVPQATEHYAGNILPIVAGPNLVPEQSPNAEILKHIQNLPSIATPGTTAPSHPYWKNR